MNRAEILGTNPKATAAAARPGMSAVPAEPLFWVGLAMQDGAQKYGRHNFRQTNVAGSVYYDAAWRHICAWWEGEDAAPDTGVPHLAHAIASLMIIMDAQARGTLHDDRPPPLPDFLEKVRAAAAIMGEIAAGRS